jgi:hypothetical protein
VSSLKKQDKAVAAYEPKGRPTTFKPEYSIDVERLCKLGVTDRDLCLWFDVSLQTIKNWKSKHPEFFIKLIKGKQTADTEVAGKLHKNATGYEYEEDQAIKMKRETRDPATGRITHTEEYIEIVRVKRFAKPDTTAQIFYLKNRRPDQWRDVVRTSEEDMIEKAKEMVGHKILEALKASGHVMLEGEYEIIGEIEGQTEEQE